jgi:hypothetical protein
VLGNVGRRQHHPLPQPRPVGAAAEQRGDVEATVVADRGDLVGLAVDRATAVALDPGEVPPVEPGLDKISDPGDGALRRTSGDVRAFAAQVRESRLWAPPRQ